MIPLTGVATADTAQWEQIDFPAVRDQIIGSIQELISGSRRSPDIYRQALQLGHDAIHEQFLNGAMASCLLELRTAVIDHILQHLWHQHAADFEGLALVAVGGYGRGELHPFSDIDITILLPARQEQHDTTARDVVLSS